MAHIISVSNRKGGSGKTTVAVNLAAELGARGWRVLLVDLDTQGHCAVALGMTRPRDGPAAHDVFRDGGAPLSDAVVDSAFANLWLAPADPLFEHGAGVRDQTLLRAALRDAELARRFDVVILDTPPSHDMLLLNALVAADWVMVPFLAHPLASEGMRQLMRVLFKVMAGHNRALRLAGLVPLMMNQRVRVHRSIHDEVVRQYGPVKLLAPVRSDVRLVEAMGAGRPVRYFAPASRAAGDLAQLASQLERLLA